LWQIFGNFLILKNSFRGRFFILKRGIFSTIFPSPKYFPQKITKKIATEKKIASPKWQVLKDNKINSMQTLYKVLIHQGPFF
jgi:hypothetical protein